MKKKKNIEKDIQDLRDKSFLTRRVTVKNLENILFKKFSVLDHGFIRVIDYMGDDSSIVQAARVSYGKGTKKISQDKGLINYLLSHRHSTPFEMNEIKLHIKLPIFVARQWIRHRTANVNEYSARYSVLDNEFYIPEKKNIKSQSKVNNQGRDSEVKNSDQIKKMLQANSKKNYEIYNLLLNEDKHGNVITKEKEGVARELARMVLPLNTYTQWYWKIDLHNLMHFLSLRFDKHAQYEIRVYAELILKIMKKWVPYTYDAFVKYRLSGMSFSKDGLIYLRKLLNGAKKISTNVSQREKREIDEIFGI
ncbi:MAG: thymidylate synthase (FAD) [Rickettsiales bacterium]|nr:thymidylate synthase (FAD) [Rickettsiales bacterium]